MESNSPKINKFTLNPEDKQIKKEYEQYCRYQTQSKYTKAILFDLAVVLLRVGQVIYYKYLDEEPTDGESMTFKLVSAIMWLESLLIFTIMYLMSFKFLQVLDFTAPCLVVLWSITGFCFTLEDSEERRLIGASCIFFYLFMMMFCTSDYLIALVARVLFIVIIFPFFVREVKLSVIGILIGIVFEFPVNS